ncbi:MAG TPA: hypothetical protein VD907_01435 [Verrucomicrobiae bacterium]|nr:hypothetical protein [Verrucomicrobiae bacterium]
MTATTLLHVSARADDEGFNALYGLEPPEIRLAFGEAITQHDTTKPKPGLKEFATYCEDELAYLVFNYDITGEKPNRRIVVSITQDERALSLDVEEIMASCRKWATDHENIITIEPRA